MYDNKIRVYRIISLKDISLHKVTIVCIYACTQAAHHDMEDVTGPKHDVFNAWLDEYTAMSEQEAMAELEGIAPQAQMIEQLIMAVIQMIQQGVSEAEVREFLKEQGLDDEDIEDLFMMVMEQIEQAPAQEPIGRELQGMM